nr:hypothetical protein [uncultured Mediterranean phage uvMED]
MYLKPNDEIKVINHIRHLEQINREARRIKLDDWLISIIGSSSMIGIMFIFNSLINQ